MKFAFSYGSLMATTVLLLGAVLNCDASTQLDEFGAISYQDPGDGMPFAVPIGFKSDFPIDQDTRAIGSAWIEWTLTEDAAGVELYEARDENGDITYATTAISQANTATFTLTRTAVPPPIGVTKITLLLTLYYQNSASLKIKMHEKIYEIALTATGTENTVTTSTGTGAAVTDFVTGTGATDADGLVVTPLPEGGIAFAPSGTGPVAFGSPIQVTASSTDANYHIWLDNAVPVRIYDAATSGNLIYTWPSALVGAPTSEVGTSNSLVISLNSVPVDLYNADNVFVSLGLVYRDIAGDRRALRVRMSGEELGRKLAEFAPGNAQVETQVQMAAMETDESASSSFMVAPLAMTTTAAMAGLAFLL